MSGYKCEMDEHAVCTVSVWHVMHQHLSGESGAHCGVMGANSQEARALSTFRNRRDIYAGHAACNVLLFHFQQLPCLSELEVDNLAARQGKYHLGMVNPLEETLLP